MSGGKVHLGVVGGTVPTSGSRAVGVGCHHVAPTLCHGPAVLSGALKLALGSGRVPLCAVKAIKGEHLLHVVKHVVEDPPAKSPLEGSPVAIVSFLVSPEMALKVLLVTGMPVLAENVKVFENVIKVEVEWLLEVLPVASAARVLVGEGAMSNLIILPSALII